MLVVLEVAQDAAVCRNVERVGFIETRRDDVEAHRPAVEVAGDAYRCLRELMLVEAVARRYRELPLLRKREGGVDVYRLRDVVVVGCRGGTELALSDAEAVVYG